jgi:predicted ATP-dependent protease
MTRGRDLRAELRVPAEALSGHCDPAQFTFETTDQLAALEGVFGQERAVRAIEFALGMKDSHYHLYASGAEGFGKTAIVERFLRREASQLPPPPDWIYVRNFEDSDRPVGIRLPAGEGRTFADAVTYAVERAIEDLATAFESDTYVRQRTEIGKTLEQRREALLQQLAHTAAQAGFQLQMTPTGVVSAALHEGKPITADVFETLTPEQRADIERRAHELEGSVQDAMLRMRGLEREGQEALDQLDEQVAGFAVEHLFQPLVEAHAQDREIVEFVEAVRDDLRRERGRILEQPNPALAAMGGMPSPQQQREGLKRRYAVNVFVQNDPQRGAPVILERHPTYYNLLGRIEYVGQLGTMVTDHTLVKAGSLARASGGYLVVRLRDLLTNAYAYDGLKRALDTRAVAIENLGETLGLVATSALRPEPMPLDVKVVIVGDPMLYSMLFRLDPDFRELFRVKADFETDFPRTEVNVRGLAALVSQQCQQLSLRPFTRAAVARLVEHGSRLVEDQRRLSANMGAYLDVIRQADYWAAEAGAAAVDEPHVHRALEEAEYRSSLTRDRIQQLIDEDTLLIDTTGTRVGQVNGLSVYDLGDFTFGRPSKITCVVAPGRGSIVNVEREANMAGRVHNKGFLIARAFLSERFGQGRELAVNASLTFEQLYGDIDGDSASSTEIYALLSALSELPIDQSIAVTGSVNQRGEIQPIGGATVKVEGFYEVCAARGLDGRQGVIVPRTNLENIVLRREVADAIAAGRFHVWGVSTIEEGIEILTGVPAGERAEDGTFAEGTVFRKAADRLDAFASALSQQTGMRVETRVVTPAPAAGPTPPGIPPAPPPEPPIGVEPAF